MFYKGGLQQFQFHVDWQDIPPERPSVSRFYPQYNQQVADKQ